MLNLDARQETVATRSQAVLDAHTERLVGLGRRLVLGDGGFLDDEEGAFRRLGRRLAGLEVGRRGLAPVAVRVRQFDPAVVGRARRRRAVDLAGRERQLPRLRRVEGVEAEA